MHDPHNLRRVRPHPLGQIWGSMLRRISLEDYTVRGTDPRGWEPAKLFTRGSVFPVANFHPGSTNGRPVYS
jgi:hypothetical protein